MDIVPIVFNIKPFHTDSLTRPNVKHRISSTTGSYVPSGAETPTVYYDPKQLPAGHANLTAGAQNKLPIPRTVDEQADSAARKCIMYFGPGNNPRLSIGARNQVTVDAGGKIHLIDDIDVYRQAVSKGTWNSVIKLADELREKKIKIGFFSSTPQGGESFSRRVSFAPLGSVLLPDRVFFRARCESRGVPFRVSGLPRTGFFM